MICPNCTQDNPDTAKFCNNCGHKLAAPCSNCGHENPPGSRFCNNCGSKLAAPEAPPESGRSAPHKDIQALIPDAFAAKLASARASQTMVGERRIVTMLFCDITGSTAAAGDLDPEEWALVMNQAFEAMIAPVYKYEGTVARLMGDAILAFFGAPIAHEDDPQRAVLAGLEIAAGVRPFKEKVLREWGLEIDARVGINTGLVMVGQVGSDLQMEYTALGDAINLAARMEQTAEPGTVQISEHTHKSVAPLFEFMDLGEISIKGKSEPVHTYRPLRTMKQAVRQRGIEGMDSPLVGRSAELTSLRSALDSLEKGNGGIVFLIGEAGLGKSRLIQELKPANGSSPLHWFEAASLSYEMSQPYALFQRLLRRMWRITPNETAGTTREKIRQGLAGHAGDQALFEILLGVAAQEEQSIVEGETFKRKLYRTMADLWRRQAAAGPVVFVLDDLHWTDPASMELLLHLADLIEQLPLLLFCVLRQDRDAPAWDFKGMAEERYPHRFQAIALRALGEQETNALVDNLLTISDLTPQLRARIMEKADGNPFFVEEVVRTLIDNGIVVKETLGDEVHWRTAGELSEAHIPDNLQTLLTARIDRLDEAARRTLQLASVIGRSFYYRVLETIHETAAQDTADLDGELITLQRKELIRQQARLPEPEYLFRHALTQEAAYSTILIRERRVFHRRVGEAIEQLFAERLEDFYPVLAHHFGQADDRRAKRYERLAGDAAFRLFAIPQALDHYSTALELTRLAEQRAGDSLRRDEPADNSPETIIHLFLRRGRCLELQSDYAAAQQNYAELQTLARERENPQMLLAALVDGAAAYAIPSPAQDAEKGEVLAAEALALAREIGDQRAEAKLLWVFLLLKAYAGSMPEGIPYGEQSVELARRLGMREQLAYSLQDLGMTRMALGRIETARTAFEEAASLWERLHNLPMLAENWTNISYIRIMAGEFDGALAASEESLRLAKSIGNERGQVNARGFVGLAPIARGEVDQALALVQDMIADAERVGHPAHMLGWFYLGRLYTHLGAYARSAEAAERGLAASVGFPPFRPANLAMAARERIREGNFAAAEDLLAEAKQLGAGSTLQAIELLVGMVETETFLARRDFERAEEKMAVSLAKARKSGARYFLADALRLQAALHRVMGRSDAARESLEEARKAAEQIEARIVLWQILAELGDNEAAREVIDFIAGNISEKALRQDFLAHAQKKLEA